MTIVQKTIGHHPTQQDTIRYIVAETLSLTCCCVVWLKGNQNIPVQNGCYISHF